MFDRSKKYYKIFNEADLHHGFQYKDGLNIDTVSFNNVPDLSCVKGGLYFSDSEYIGMFIDHGNYIREVDIPEEANVIDDYNEWRSDQLFLHERKDLRKTNTWKWMSEQGINIHVYNEFPLQLVCKLGHFDVVKYLVVNGVDIHSSDDYALRMACKYGHIEIVNFLIENGANIHAQHNYALIKSIRYGHLDIVKLLLENGFDNDYALDWACSYAKTEIIEYLESKIKEECKNV